MIEKHNSWKDLWSKKSADAEILQSGDTQKIFLELKRSCGFDVVGEGLSYESFLEQYRWTKENLFHAPCFQGKQFNSIFEVGCGSGANLLLFEKDGFTCGGIDYSPKLTACAKQVLHTKDILCAEASELPVEPQYDAVLSNSVFSYFPDKDYAAAVLRKMCRKAKYTIGIIDIHDNAKRTSFLAYRRASVPDYEERYKNLPKLFYDKQFFVEFAEKENMEIRITDDPMEGYWNNGFVFHCFLYKR